MKNPLLGGVISPKSSRPILFPKISCLFEVGESARMPQYVLEEQLEDGANLQTAENSPYSSMPSSRAV